MHSRAHTMALAAALVIPVAAVCGAARSIQAPPVAPLQGVARSGGQQPAESTPQPGGAVGGRIIGRDNTPVAGAIVEALVSRTVDGRTTLVAIAKTTTGADGEFRLAALPAGLCYVRASLPPRGAGALAEPPTYYPGVVFAEEASRVSVAPGGVEPSQRIVFTLQSVRPSRVAGRLTARDGRQLLSAALSMRPARADGLSDLSSHEIAILPDGAFTFQNVPPGDYLIRARGDVDSLGPSLFGTFRVRVEGRDIENVELALTPGARLEGRIFIESTGSRTRDVLRGLRVRAPSTDGGTFGDALTGDVQPDGSYAIRGLVAGSHAITLEGLRDPWALKSITWRGRDIMDTGLDAESQQVYSDVRITITDTANETSGAVRDTQGIAVADATVLFIPVHTQYWTKTSIRLRLLRADGAGHYVVRGLPPGEYKAVAVRELEGRDPYGRELLQTLSAAGVHLIVRGLTPLRVDLPLTMVARLSPSR